MTHRSGGDHVLRRACRQMVRWRAELGEAAPPSVAGDESATLRGLAERGETGDEVIERCFHGTVSRLQGVSFAVLEVGAVEAVWIIERSVALAFMRDRLGLG